MLDCGKTLLNSANTCYPFPAWKASDNAKVVTGTQLREDTKNECSLINKTKKSATYFKTLNFLEFDSNA